MSYTTIEWTDQTWNPVTGCTKTSDGCKNCYAKDIANKKRLEGEEKYKYGFDIVKCHPETLSLPYKWKMPQKIFVNSMSDLFHKDVPFDFIKQVFQVMHHNEHLTFQILTKRPACLLELNPQLKWTDNIWMGVSVENEKVINRIDLLRQTDAKVKFLSIEPLLGSLNNLNLIGIDWVIVGGEKAENARPMKEEWVLDIQQQCKDQNVKFFFKQWGGKYGDGGDLLNGKRYKEIPEYTPSFFGMQIY
ncbi:phage Gp37/Gp68 family protein [Parabacteroides sp. PF5-6]|uniref:DUF5131 family protein n=1 Tax=Parabacteroides sp. PF5-6 TaxID=1742403 RepID=UPI002405BC1A|nr:phage Gp37/Gp68 family protein [Parabacteroides sp. PF5-6]MDF9830033.1 protein gp37 [Parabacteroides sp. PF5-6]